MDFFAAYDAWLEDCAEELVALGYTPDEWEVSEDGSIYLVENAFVNVRHVVTPWEDSPHYVSF